MTAGTAHLAPARSPLAAGWLVPVGLLAGLAAIVGVRWLATRGGMDPLLVGLALGLALAGLAGLARLASPAGLTGRASLRREMAIDPVRLRWVDATRDGAARRLAIAIAAGAAFGLALVGIALLGPALASSVTVPGLGRPAAPFMPWVAVTLVVASAEEVLLRGVLLDRVRHASGLGGAVVLTSAVFALMHVPLYGWHVVPLDFAVGLGLAGLRLTTRSIVAPVAAHSVADLATWWL